MTLRLLVLAFTLLSAFCACGADLSGNNLLVPVSGRTSGSHGSQWETDLVITNVTAEAAPVVVTFYGPAENERSFTTQTVEGRGTVVIEDVMEKLFDVSSGIGMIRVSSAREGSRLTARAYVVNRGHAAGEYGQGVPAVPVDSLMTEHVLSGVTSSNGRRTNAGVANPWPVAATVILTLHDGAGQQLAHMVRTVPAFQVLQLNDVFTAFGVAPSNEASVRVTAQAGVYAYASIVRNDTGDAVFVPGTGVGVNSLSVAPPRCSEPAYLGVAKSDQQPADGWIVVMQPGTTIDYVTKTLPANHGFAIRTLYQTLLGFAAELTPQQLAGLRCDAAVAFIEQNVAVSLP